MPNSSDTANKVPLMFRAQVEGRCQIQRLVPKAPEQYATRWADEWVIEAYPNAPDFGDDAQTKIYELSWRFVTNSGQDDGVIRPVIGARGWPYYPGSSMKGLFRQAAQRMEQLGELKEGTCDRYCGIESKQDPGILRFHGGYPTDTRWTENLVDIVHPQQDQQVKSDARSSSAFIQISLYKPELKFGISSTETLDETEWAQIWAIWETALSMGLGCRVSAGYGQPENHTGEILYRARLKGQGQAAKLIDGTGEFRPNIFRAAIRGHALRIFGGLTDERTAETLVKTLFGGIQGGTFVGLLSMAFHDTRLELGEFGQGSYAQPTYSVEGDLLWMLTRDLPDKQKQALTKLIEALTRFAMVFGGFGKSWRRADHRLVHPEYYDQGYKPLIGCHWEWSGKRSQIRDVRVRKLEKVGDFIEEVRQIAREWMELQSITPQPGNYANWREAWHPDNVQVWGRETDGIEDSEAVKWLHGPYREAIPSAGIPEGSIYRSSVTGRMGQIGRLWHRMFPKVRLVKDPENPKKPKPLVTRQYFELVTLFPDQSSESDELLNFLESQQKLFKKLWPKAKPDDEERS
jgi:CRISPR-associated protein Cmr6